MTVRILYKATNLAIVFVLAALRTLILFNHKHEFPKLILLSLSKNQINQNKSVEDFLRFLCDDRFEFDILNEPVLLEVRQIFPHKFSKKNHGLIITRDLYLYLALQHLEFKNYINLYHELNSNSVNLTRFNARHYKQSVLDVSIWNLIVSNIKKQIFLVTTQTHMINLPFIFQRDYKLIRKIMMWYSTNSVPLYKVGELQSSHWLGKDVVNCIDKHLIWNTTQALDLAKQGIKQYKIVGSILFYPKTVAKAKSKNVTFFDVTPFANGKTIYSEVSCILSLLDITNAIIELNEESDIPLVLRVKPKRRYSKLHSQKYISLLGELHKQGKLQLLDCDENLYSCISSSRAILSVPYSSPIEIGVEMGVPGAYYFIENTDWNLNSVGKLSPLFTAKSELKTWLEINANYN